MAADSVAAVQCLRGGLECAGRVSVDEDKVEWAEGLGLVSNCEG